MSPENVQQPPLLFGSSKIVLFLFFFHLLLRERFHQSFFVESTSSTTHENKLLTSIALFCGNILFLSLFLSLYPWHLFLLTTQTQSVFLDSLDAITMATTVAPTPYRRSTWSATVEGKGERGQRSRVSSVRRQVKEDLSDNGLAGMQPCVQPELMDTAERCYRQRGSQCQPRLERVK